MDLRQNILRDPGSSKTASTVGSNRNRVKTDLTWVLILKGENYNRDNIVSSLHTNTCELSKMPMHVRIVQSHNIVHVSGMRCHMGTSSTGGCAFVYCIK